MSVATEVLRRRLTARLRRRRKHKAAKHEAVPVRSVRAGLSDSQNTGPARPELAGRPVYERLTAAAGRHAQALWIDADVGQREGAGE
jgi:hypothetical protein